MDAYDRDNNKIGVVREINPPAGPDEPFFVKVRTAFLGLGHTQLSPTAVHTRLLFIPSDSLRLSDHQLQVTVERARIDQMGWGTTPRGIRD
jgi:hypothetical protein